MHIYTAQLVDKVIDSGLTTSFYSKFCSCESETARYKCSGISLSQQQNRAIKANG